jgi:hypothetical protein
VPQHLSSDAIDVKYVDCITSSTVLNEWQKMHSSSNKLIGVSSLFNSVVPPMSLDKTCFVDTLLSLYES